MSGKGLEGQFEIVNDLDEREEQGDKRGDQEVRLSSKNRPWQNGRGLHCTPGPTRAYLLLWCKYLFVPGVVTPSEGSTQSETGRGSL